MKRRQTNSRERDGFMTGRRGGENLFRSFHEYPCGQRSPVRSSLTYHTESVLIELRPTRKNSCPAIFVHCSIHSSISAHEFPLTKRSKQILLHEVENSSTHSISHALPRIIQFYR